MFSFYADIFLAGPPLPDFVEGFDGMVLMRWSMLYAWFLNFTIRMLKFILQKFGCLMMDWVPWFGVLTITTDVDT